jgi:hypothetical protein
MRTYRAFGPILAAATGLVLSSCDSFPAQQHIGVTSGPDGKPAIVYLACPGESIRSVEIVIPVDNPGGGDDTVLWRIESTQQSTDESAFVVGGLPPSGFVEAVSLARALPTGVTLTGIVSTSRASGVVVPFRLAGVREGMIRNDIGRYIKPSDFRTAAHDTCTAD